VQCTNRRGGVNEIHLASALIATLVYGIAGVSEVETLAFQPLMVAAQLFTPG